MQGERVGVNWNPRERGRKQRFATFVFETRGSTLCTTGRILCNKGVYILFRMTRALPVSGSLRSPWHWHRCPFSLRGKVLWSRSLGGWFSPENESAIECMLEMGNYEPVEWVTPHAGDIFLDIGAFVGWHTIQAARIVGPSGHVISLEPDASNRNQLKRNLALNGITNCTVLSSAAWSDTGYDLGWYNGKSPDCCKVEDTQRTLTVKTISLDDLVVQFGLDRLDWIKMDIEGGEVEALKGAKETLCRLRPSLFVEIHNTIAGVKELLAQCNYSIEREAFDGSPEPHGWYFARPI